MSEWLTMPNETTTKGFNLVLFQVRHGSKPLPRESEWISKPTKLTPNFQQDLLADEHCHEFFITAFNAWHFEQRQGGISEVKFCEYFNTGWVEIQDIIQQESTKQSDRLHSLGYPHFSDNGGNYNELEPVQMQRDQLVVHIFDNSLTLTRTQKRELTESCPFDNNYEYSLHHGRVTLNQTLRHRVVQKFCVYPGDNAKLEAHEALGGTFCKANFGVLEVIIVKTHLI